MQTSTAPATPVLSVFLSQVPDPFARAGCLVGLMVKAFASRAEDAGIPLASGIFLGPSHSSDLIIGTPVATLPGAWSYRVSAGLVGPLSVYCDWVRWTV